MNLQMRQLRRQQLDRTMRKNRKLITSNAHKGWINNVRTSLGMSMSQLGKSLNISASAVAQLEKNEQKMNITLRSLDKTAKALGLRLVYGFASLPNTSLEKTIAWQAEKKAREIVAKADQTMSLERQANSLSRLKRAVKERAAEIIHNHPRSLWD